MEQTVCYISIAGQKIYFKSALKCIQSCFFLYLGLNIQYPDECHHIWQFIQTYVFEVTTPYDKKIPMIDSLVKGLDLN